MNEKLTFKGFLIGQVVVWTILFCAMTFPIQTRIVLWVISALSLGYWLCHQEEYEMGFGAGLCLVFSTLTL